MKKIIGFMLVFIMVFPFFLETFTYAYENNKIENIEKINNSNTENIWEEKTTNNQENKNNILENNKTNNNENKIDKDEKENNENKNSEEIDTLQSFEETNNNEQENLKTPVVNQSNKTIEDGTYYIRTAINRNKVFDIEGMSKANQARLQLWERSSQLTDNQKFEITYLSDGYYKIEAKHSGKSLDVMGAGKANCTKVQQYESNGTDAQQWIIKDAGDGYYNIISKCNDLYLDIPSASAVNGAKIQMYEGNGSTAQKFKLEKIEELVGKQTIEDGEYKIKSASNTNMVIDIDGLSRTNGASAQIWEESELVRKNQRFNISWLGNGYYKIEVRHSGKVLDVVSASKLNGTKIQQYESNGTDAQQWIIKDAGNGCYNIISKCNGLYLDITNSKAVNGAKMQVYEKNSSDTQKFIFEKVDKEKCNKTLENGVYKISTGLNSNMVLDIAEGSQQNCANLQIWGKGTTQQQKFQVTYNTDGYYEIKAVHSGKVLDIAGASSNNGANVQQYESNGTDAQKWILRDAGNGYYYIISRGAEAYLDVVSGRSSNGTNVDIYDGNGTAAQKFKFESVPIIANDEYNIKTALDNNKALDVDLGTSNVQIWTLNLLSTNQAFKVENLNNGYYKITCNSTNKVLTNVNNNVVQSDYTGSDNQQWKIEVAGNNYYYIKLKDTNLYLDIQGAHSTDGTNVQVYEGNKSVAQKFKFETKRIFYGIDVSEWNNIINWIDVKNSNRVNFAMIRAGYRGFVSGQLMTDTGFARNVMQANAMGINVGIYFFTQAVNESEAITEADYVVGLLRQYNVNVKYPIAIDTENSGSKTNGRLDYEGRADKLDVQTRTAVCRAFCERIRSYGYTPMIYASRDWFYYNLDISQLNSYEHWVAHYTGSTSRPTDYAHPYTMWQYTSKGYVPGIVGNTDLNVGYKKY